MLNHEPNNGTPLTDTTKSEDVEHGPCDHRLKVKDYRKLAICSILCGLSCLGIVSLIYSIKTRECNKRSLGATSTKAKEYSQKALKWGIGAIVAWWLLIFLTPPLVGLLSYLLTLYD
ncbi:hypothetical protein C0J50_2411 [Silurus asotus]|uniref:Transmembrane protein 265 n=1 Tax=Silurus asotus TaxID=30991 RepID=A0AAD5B6I9_SILAS|nr:hypothetical protein C0J50_2411 [Silurus asotus]